MFGRNGLASEWIGLHFARWPYDEKLSATLYVRPNLATVVVVVVDVVMQRLAKVSGGGRAPLAGRPGGVAPAEISQGDKISIWPALFGRQARAQEDEDDDGEMARRLAR